MYGRVIHTSLRPDFPDGYAIVSSLPWRAQVFDIPSGLLNLLRDQTIQPVLDQLQGHLLQGGIQSSPIHKQQPPYAVPDLVVSVSDRDKVTMKIWMKRMEMVFEWSAVVVGGGCGG